jgi:hypothetical protein
MGPAFFMSRIQEVFPMNQDQLTNMLKVIVPFACALLASSGIKIFGDSSIVLQITSAVIAVAAVVWTFVSHTDAAKLQSAAAVDPGVKISVPVSVMNDDVKVAALVQNTDVPNVVALKPGL